MGDWNYCRWTDEHVLDSLGLLRCVVHYFLLDDVYQLDALVGNTRAETLRSGHEFYGHVKYWTEVRFSAVKH